MSFQDTLKMDLTAQIKRQLSLGVQELSRSIFYGWPQTRGLVQATYFWSGQNSSPSVFQLFLSQKYGQLHRYHLRPGMLLTNITFAELTSMFQTRHAFRFDGR